jgi:hypothetical protein
MAADPLGRAGDRLLRHTVPTCCRTPCVQSEPLLLGEPRAGSVRTAGFAGNAFTPTVRRRPVSSKRPVYLAGRLANDTEASEARAADFAPFRGEAR